MASLQTWYKLTKPGIIFGNAIHFIAGFLLSYTLGGSVLSGLVGLLGTSLLIASACVANNYIDRDIDSHMKRTKKRAIVNGEISGYAAILYAVILAAVALSLLLWVKLWLVALLGVVAYITYVWVYTYAKRTTIHSTLIGTIPGAIPVVAGYAVADNFSWLVAVILFLLLVSWQMPHFYAISLFRKKEYKAAKLPVAGVLLPAKEVGRHMLDWSVLYLGLVLGLIFSDALGLIPGLISVVLAAAWVYKISQGSASRYADIWARSVFGQSLLLSLTLLGVAFLNLFV